MVWSGVGLSLVTSAATKRCLRFIPNVETDLAHLHPAARDPHDKHTHLNRARTIQDIRRHNGAVLGKGDRNITPSTTPF